MKHCDEGVTNQPRDLRLLAMSGAVRQVRRDSRPSWMLMAGVLLGILLCMALSLWREAARAASERHGQLPATNSTGAAGALEFDMRLASMPGPATSGTAEITTYGLAYRPTKRRPRPRTASGAVYDYRKHTAAVNRIGRAPALPFGTRVRITYRGRSVTVTIIDTGGHKPRGASIWFDLSCAAMADLLGRPLNPQSAYNTRFVATWERAS